MGDNIWNMCGHGSRILSGFQVFVFLLTAASANAQGVITTVAGTTWTFPPSPLPAVNAPLGQTTGIAVDAKGNVYIADGGNKHGHASGA